MHKVGGELDDVGERGALRGQRQADVAKVCAHCASKSAPVAAVLVGADLAGDEQEFGRLHPA